MITEDYVNFETAKLLKEKGFDFCCEFQYINCSSGHPFLTDIRDDAGCYYKNSEIEQDAYSAPTLQMAMKWLREVHEIFIEIPIYSIAKPVLYRWNAFKNGRLVTDEEKPKTSNCIIKGDDNNPTVYYYKYEEACATAIKYCLENLL